MGFTSFLARRTLLGVVVMWAVTTATFLLFFVAPQNPARLIAGKGATAAEIAGITRRLGLDQPVPVQYWRYLGRLLHLDLGISYRNGAPVSTILRHDLPPTLSVLAGGVVLWLFAGISAGILSATRARSLLDRMSSVGVLIGLTFPAFVLGLLLLRAVYLPLNRAGLHWIQTGYEAPTQSVAGWAGHMILPWITIAALSAATYARLIRASLLETLSEDYIRTARAKGLSERRVRYRHAVRAALTPVISQLGIDIGALAGGAVVTEQVFGLGGIGQQFLVSTLAGDIPVVLAITLIGALFVVTANLIAELLYSVLDPRVQLA